MKKSKEKAYKLKMIPINHGHVGEKLVIGLAHARVLASVHRTTTHKTTVNTIFSI